MTLLQLNYFLAVYQYRNMTKAAEASYISQPSISNAIRDLETELGTPLFWRNKGLEPTAAGEKLAALAAPLVKQFERIPEEVRRYLCQLPARVKLGIETVIGDFFDDRFLDLLEDASSLLERVNYCGIDYLERCVSDGTMDFALITSVGELEDPRFHIHSIYHGGISLYVHREDPLAARSALRPREMAGIPIAGFADLAMPQEEYRQLLGQMLGGIPPANIVCYSTSLSTIYRIVQKGIAGAILLGGLFTPEGIREVPIETEKGIRISLIWRGDRVLTGEELSFIRRVERLFVFAERE